jgi:AAA+ superfamily predicted ATPase
VSDLFQSLHLRVPLLWVTSDESARVVEEVTTTIQDRNVFRLDTLKGLLQFSRTKIRWLRVATIVEGEPQPIYDPSVAFQYVMNDRGVMIIEHAHLQIEALTGFFTSIFHEFRNAVQRDDFTQIPAQFVLISHKDDVPGEFARTITRISHDLPDAKTLTGFVQVLATRRGVDTTADCDRIVRAAQGLSEYEFYNVALTSIKDNGFIDPKYVASRKVATLKKSGLLDVSTPDFTVDSLGGLDNAKKLIHTVSDIWNHPEEARAAGVTPIKRVLLVGVPGAGKSLVCEATANMLGLDLARGGVSSAMSKWLGESEANMRRMFASLKAMKPIVFWIDELGRDLSGGGTSNDSGTTDRVHGEFLTNLQELPDEIFLIAAANRIDGLPPEMLRADRFDKIMFVGFPTAEERTEIFSIHLGAKAKEFDTVKLAEATPQFTGAEIKSLIKEVRFNVFSDDNRRPINTEDLLRHIPQVKGRIWVNRRPAIIEMYERAKSEWDWASSGQKEESDALLLQARSSFAPVASYAPSQKRKVQAKI